MVIVVVGVGAVTVVVVVELCNTEVNIKVMVFQAVTFKFGTEDHTFQKNRSLYQYIILTRKTNTSIQGTKSTSV
jgi:hypothetical protein